MLIFLSNFSLNFITFILNFTAKRYIPKVTKFFKKLYSYV